MGGILSILPTEKISNDIELEIFPKKLEKLIFVWASG